MCSRSIGPSVLFNGVDRAGSSNMASCLGLDMPNFIGPSQVSKRNCGVVEGLDPEESLSSDLFSSPELFWRDVDGVTLHWLDASLKARLMGLRVEVPDLDVDFAGTNRRTENFFFGVVTGSWYVARKVTRLVGLFCNFGLNEACRANGECGEPGDAEGVCAYCGKRAGLEGDRESERRKFAVCPPSTLIWGLCVGDGR
jgi:hypothetical protein